MDFNAERVCILQKPFYKSIGLKGLYLWFLSSIWPVNLFQATICTALGFSVNFYPKFSYFESVKERINNINSYLIPPFIGDETVFYILAAELSTFYLTMLVFIRRLFLRWTLSYTRWIYCTEEFSDNSMRGRLYRFCIWLGWGSNPRTFDTDKILPSLPLPAVDLTIKRLMGSLAPYLGYEKPRYQHLESGLTKWCKAEGRGCQRRLWVKKWLYGNYTTLWWESYTFLCHRQPNFVDTTLTAFQETECPYTKNPLARAAVLLYLYGNLRSLLKGGIIEPEMLRDKVPLCMAQWNRVHSTTRKVTPNEDELWTYPTLESPHIIVVFRNHYYKVPLFTKWRKIVSPDLLQEMLAFVVSDATKRAAKGKEIIYPQSLLTTLSRDEWQKCRSDFFTYGVNYYSLNEIEKAICFVHLSSQPSTTPQQTRGYLWTDKSINFFVHQDSKVSIHADWAAMDPWIFAAVLERLRAGENEDMYDGESGNAAYLEEADHECPELELLPWKCYDEMTKIYKKALRSCQADLKALASSRLHFTAFGRERIRDEWNLSTDAFIQVALHTAYFRMSRNLALCAEIVPCRLYANGRSETLRSLTTEMEDFLLEFDHSGGGKGDSKGSSKCLELMSLACKRHEFLLKHAMTGRGIDRHLLALNVAHGFRTYMHCEEMETAVNMPFDLVTCRLPNSPSKSAWQMTLPLMYYTNAIHVTYASRTDQECLDFSITGIGIRVEQFKKNLESALYDLAELLD